MMTWSKNLSVIRRIIPKVFIKRRFVNTYLNEFPELNKTRGKSEAYILDQDLAAEVGEKLAPHLMKDDSLLLEVNPGPGYLTNILLQYGVSNLTAIERNKQFIPYLQEIGDEYPDFSYTVKDFNRNAYKENPHEFFTNLLPTLEPVDFYQDPPLKIILYPGITVQRKTLKLILHKLVNPATSFYSFGRVQFFMFLSDYEYQNLALKWPIPQKSYRERNVLFCLLFDTEHILQADSSGVYPPQRIIPKSKKTKKKSKDDADTKPSVNLVKITPKRGLFSELFDEEQMPMFSFFIRQIMNRRTERIIPKMESFFPGCGLKLIDKGFTMDLRISQISPEQFAELFRDTISWSDAEKSNFVTLYKRFTGDIDDTGTDLSSTSGVS